MTDGSKRTYTCLFVSLGIPTTAPPPLLLKHNQRSTMLSFDIIVRGSDSWRVHARLRCRWRRLRPDTQTPTHFAAADSATSGRRWRRAFRDVHTEVSATSAFLSHAREVSAFDASMLRAGPRRVLGPGRTEHGRADLGVCRQPGGHKVPAFLLLRT